MKEREEKEELGGGERIMKEKILIPENLEMLLGIFYLFLFLKIFIIRHFLKLVLECGISPVGGFFFCFNFLFLFGPHCVAYGILVP